MALARQPKFAPIPGTLLVRPSEEQPIEHGGTFKLPSVQLHTSSHHSDPQPFNVLYVSPSRIPIFEDVCAAIEETIEFVRPITRLGLPKTNIYNKCPYYRDDGPQPIPLRSIKMRQLMTEMESGRLYEQPKVHIPRSKFLYGEVSPWAVVALNAGVFAFFSVNGTG